MVVPEDAVLQLSGLLKTTDLAEIEVSFEGYSIRVRARESQNPVVVNAPLSPSVSSTTSNTVAKIHDELHIVRSPLIGTFYRASSPGAKSFVEVGQPISKGHVLCIVEAMKMMNEIESDAAGTIEKIFVENGDPVEFNTPLFALKR